MPVPKTRKKAAPGVGVRFLERRLGRESEIKRPGGEMRKRGLGQSTIGILRRWSKAQVERSETSILIVWVKGLYKKPRLQELLKGDSLAKGRCGEVFIRLTEMDWWA